MSDMEILESLKAYFAKPGVMDKVIIAADNELYNQWTPVKAWVPRGSEIVLIIYYDESNNGETITEIAYYDGLNFIYEKNNTVIIYHPALWRPLPNRLHEKVGVLKNCGNCDCFDHEKYICKREEGVKQ